MHHLKQEPKKITREVVDGIIGVEPVDFVDVPPTGIAAVRRRQGLFPHAGTEALCLGRKLGGWGGSGMLGSGEDERR